MDSVLVINSGSSSVKFALFTSATATHPALTALAERLNEPGSAIRIRGELEHQQALGEHASHRSAMQAFLQLAQPWLGNLRGVGHRVVHGGERFAHSTVIDDSNLADLASLSAPGPAA